MLLVFQATYLDISGFRLSAYTRVSPRSPPKLTPPEVMSHDAVRLLNIKASRCRSICNCRLKILRVCHDSRS